MMKKVVIIEADTNDADYTSQETIINSEQEALIRRVVGVILEHFPSGKWGHNWPTGEYENTTPDELYCGVLSMNDIEEFDEYVPYGEYGVHTIKSVRIVVIAKEEELL